MKKRNNALSIVIGAIIAIPLSVYINQQQELNAKAHKDDLKPVAEVQMIELQEEAIQEEFAEDELAFVSLGEFKLTAYCSCESCCDGWSKNRPVDESGNQIVIGASGSVLEAGTSIAVDANVIPYDTKVIINEREYIAHDCGGAIEGNHIDVYMSNHEEALKFGVQYAEVFINKQ